MAIIDDLKSWFERDIRGATWDDNVKVDDSDPEKIDVRFYTDTNEYILTIFPNGEDVPLVDSLVRPRKARAGLNVVPERNLLAGGQIRLTEGAWRRILFRIVGLELVRIHAAPQPAKAPNATALT